MKVYPSYRYHPEHDARVVANEIESDAAAKDGWFETPADFPPVVEAPPAQAKKK